MTSHKCPKCGLVSFATTGSCKRCQASLNVSAEAAASFAAREIDDAEPQRRFSPLRVLLLILLIAIPGWLYYRAQEQALADQIEQRKKQEREESIKANTDSFNRCRPGLDCW